MAIKFSHQTAPATLSAANPSAGTPGTATPGTAAAGARRPARRTRLIAGAAGVMTLVLAACGGSVPLTASGNDAEPAAAAPAAATPVAATIGASDLGEIMAGSNGLTLYGFTNDVDAASTCTGTCAEAWPPVIVDDSFSVAPSLDVGIFATTVRDDGSLQLVAGKWPLYFFAGDVVPGDITGQGSGDVWFAVAPDGSLITEAPAAESAASPLATVSQAESALGPILTDPAGLSLYGFTEDVDGVPTCNDACADAWPPVILSAGELPADLDPATFSVVQRSDGQFQLAAGVWPLYRFAGDGAPGDLNGQGSGEVWFLAAPDGSLIGAGEPSGESAPATEVVEDDDGY